MSVLVALKLVAEYECGGAQPGQLVGTPSGRNRHHPEFRYNFLPVDGVCMILLYSLVILIPK